MRLFISWSGAASRHVARALHDWLPDVIQVLEPWMSDNSIDKGSRWNVELSQQLEEVDQGIVCVTSANMREPWLNFEAGALAKSLKGRVRPVLLDLKSTELTGPLASFQTTDARDRVDVLTMLRSINSGLDHPLSDERLERQFSSRWRELEEQLDRAPGEDQGGQGVRSIEDMVSEALTIVRQLARKAEPPAIRQDVQWRKSQKSMGIGGGIEVARIGDGFAVRDSSDSDESPLFYSKEEFEKFVEGTKRGEFDHLL